MEGQCELQAVTEKHRDWWWTVSVKKNAIQKFSTYSSNTISLSLSAENNNFEYAEQEIKPPEAFFTILSHACGSFHGISTSIWKQDPSQYGVCASHYANLVAGRWSKEWNTGYDFLRLRKRRVEHGIWFPTHKWFPRLAQECGWAYGTKMQRQSMETIVPIIENIVTRTSTWT